MRIRRVVSHAFRPAPSPFEASRSTSNPPIRSLIITVVVKVYFVSCRVAKHGVTKGLRDNFPRHATKRHATDQATEEIQDVFLFFA